MKNEPWISCPAPWASWPRVPHALALPTVALAPVMAMVVGGLAAWGASSIADPADPMHLRAWSCLAGASAFLHLIRVTAERPWILSVALLAVAGLQFAAAIRGASNDPGLVAAAFALGAGVGMTGIRREEGVLARWGWWAFQGVAAVVLVT